MIVSSCMQVGRSQDFFGIPLFGPPSKETNGEVSKPDPKEPDKSLPNTEAKESLPAELEEFWKAYRDARSQGFLKVNGDYARKLDAVVEAFKKRANLDGALATTKEIQRVEAENQALKNGRDFPPLKAAIAEGEQALPRELMRAFRKQVEQKALGVTILNKNIAGQMENLKTTLVRAGELTKARAVERSILALKAEIESLKEPFKDAKDSPPESAEELEDLLTGTTWKVPTGQYKGMFKFTEGRTIERYIGQKNPIWTAKYKVSDDRKIEFDFKGASRTISFRKDLKRFLQEGTEIEAVLEEE